MVTVVTMLPELPSKRESRLIEMSSLYNALDLIDALIVHHTSRIR